MSTIFCLMGKSSSGKDTIYKRLLTRDDLALSRIVPYTTRPIRGNETDGVEYHFCDEKTREDLAAAGKIIESRSYDTMHGIWYYFTVDDGQIDLSTRDYLMIGTLDTYESLLRYYENPSGNDFANTRILPIYIEVEDGVRLQRALDREKEQKNPRYEEMCRRFLADSRDFSDERLRSAGITDAQIFRNEDVSRTTERVAAYIRDVQALAEK